MYRIGFIIVVGVAVALGLLIGALNPDPVEIDLLWIQFEWPVGLLILSAFAAGLLLGLVLTWLVGILPLRVKLRRHSASRSRASTDSYPLEHD